MPPTLRLCLMLPALPLLAADATPKLPGVSAAMQSAVDARELSGAVTVVVTRNQLIHCEANGLADPTRSEPMRPDSVFWIASMTKPITGVAVLMLQDEGKLNVADPVARHIPEFARLKTPSGRPANLTLAQLMTHTSGLGEGDAKAVGQAHTLAELIPVFLAAPMQFEPGTQWRHYARFCQMLLAGGSLDGRRYLSPEAMKLLTTVQTGDLPTGFFQSPDSGNRGVNYGWGIGTCILRAPHPGVAAMLSPGTFGHGGAWGTQAWIDPARGVAYILMLQRPDLGNSDGSEFRRAFQQAAAEALPR